MNSDQQQDGGRSVALWDRDAVGWRQKRRKLKAESKKEKGHIKDLSHTEPTELSLSWPMARYRLPKSSQ